MFKRFLRSESGNVAILAGFVMLPAFIVLGAGYDVMRATSNSTKLRSVLEGAALAAASLTNAREAETVIDEYLDANLVKDTGIRDSLAVTFVESGALNSRTVEITASAEVATHFLRIVGISALPVKAKTVANQSKTTVELALVMDVSSSMNGQKLINLKSAATDFVDQILNERNISETSMSLVPFGGTVNIGEMFDEYAVPEAAAVVDPSQPEYTRGASVPERNFRFTDGDTCIEYVNDDFNDGPLPTLSRPQVPHFWKWTNFNPWCPTAESAVMMNTNNKTELKSHIEGMILSDGTGMDIGMMWGAKALSPDWRGVVGGDFADRPYAYGDSMKVLVVMTDGEITEQVRPKDFTAGNTHSNRPNEINQSPQAQSKSGNWTPWRQEYGNTNNKNEQLVLPKGGVGAHANADNAIGHFKRLCDEARANNVVVYSIGFDIDDGGLADDLLEYCASDPSKYFFVENLDIQSAFDSIAASVNSLRIVG